MRVTSNSLTSLAARVDRVVAAWINPAVVDETERAVQARLMGRCVMAAIAALPLVPLLLAPAVAPEAALAAGVLGCALFLLLAASLSLGGARRHTGILALFSAATAVGALAGATGGLASPYAAWLAVPVVEAIVGGRTARWAGVGALAAVGSAVLALAVDSRMGAASVSPAADCAALAATILYIALRLPSVLDTAVPDTAAEPARADPWAPLLDNLSGVVTVHDRRGHVLSVHGADATTAGWLQSPLGRGFLDQIHVADRIGFFQALDQLRKGAGRAAADVRLQRADATLTGEQFVHLRVELAAAPLGRDGEAVFVAQSRDVTAERALRESADRKAVAAESANAAKSRFLAAVSHELRTPLNAILGFSDVLAHEFFGAFANDRQREYVDLIRASGAHLLSVVNTMLDMSKIEAGRYEIIAEPFAVADAVAGCEQMLSLQAQKNGVALVTRVARGCETLVADRRAVNQILINLVANGIKFTEKGGVVTVDAAMHGDRFVLSVADTGIGIAADALETIGEPFVQAEGGTARAYEGSGLGLSLVKGLVALHGGTFAIDSKLGHGTVVTINFARDGSGVARTDRQESRTVEFPPRLAGARGQEHRYMEGRNDDAKARTA